MLDLYNDRKDPSINGDIDLRSSGAAEVDIIYITKITANENQLQQTTINYYELLLLLLMIHCFLALRKATVFIIILLLLWYVFIYIVMLFLFNFISFVYLLF